MEKKLISILLFIFAFQFTEAKRIEAKLVDINGEAFAVKLKVKVSVFSREVNCGLLQKKIVFFNSRGKRYKLRPDDIESLEFEYFGRKYLMYSVDDNLTFSRFRKILLKVEQDGYLKRFIYFERQSGGFYGSNGMYNSSSYTVAIDVLKKGNGPLYRVGSFRFKKYMAEYFRDYPKLAEKISNKELRYRDLNTIIDLYNTWHTEQNSDLED